MRLVQIFLPLYDNQREPFPKLAFDRVREELTARFGGVTAFLRAPAVGLWERDAGVVCRDDVVLVEVMVEDLDRGWWGAYRAELESRFSQDAILIRATEIECL